MRIRTREQFLPGGIFNPAPVVKHEYKEPKVTLSRKNRLTSRQRAFTTEYLNSGNGRQAAIKAGYAVNNAAIAADHLINKPWIASEITKVQEQRRQRHEVTADRVIEELGKLAFANMADYMKPTPSGDPYVDFSTLTREQAAALSEVTVESYYDGKGPNSREIKRIRFKLHDKHAALLSLARHFGLFNDREDKFIDARSDVYSAVLDAANRIAARRDAGGVNTLARPEDGGSPAVRMEVLGPPEPTPSPGDD